MSDSHPIPAPDVQISPSLFQRRVSILFVTIHAPHGIFLPYFPLWLKASDFSANEIAVILSLPMFVRIIGGPIVSALADRAGDRVPVLGVCAVLAAIACAGFFLEPSYGTALAVSILLALAWGPHQPLSDSIALSGVHRLGVSYAAMRVWGSISFLSLNIAGGWILAFTGAGVVPVLMFATLASIGLATLYVPRLGRPATITPNAVESLPEVGFVLRNPYFLTMIAASALAQGSHAFLYSFGSIYYRSLGVGEGVVGLLWAFSVVAEVGMFAVFGRLFQRVSTPAILVLGCAVGLLRWLVYPHVWPAGLGIGGFLAVQALHGGSFSLVFLATQRMFTETVPESRTGAAQGFAYLLTGICLATVTLASGPFYEAFGVHGFYGMAAIMAAALALGLAGTALAPERRAGR